MFNNILKWSTGRTNIKVIATILVITLTFANFALLGSFIKESFALDSGERATNVDNVKFEAYLDKLDNTKTELTADLNAEDITLYVSIDVQQEGKLKNAQIDFSNSNFELKGKSGEYKKSIETIEEGSSKVIEIPIVARKDSKYKLDLLNMDSTVKLTGEYVDGKGNVSNVDSSRTLKINWNTNSITKDQVTLSEELITNKIYKVNGQDKRVIQLLVSSKVNENKAPVESEKIKIDLPKFGEFEPEEIKVLASTTAANGKTVISPMKYEATNNTEVDNYTYPSDKSRVEINVFNKADENGNVSWAKNAVDSFIVTVVYSKDAAITSLESNTSIELKLYGKQEAIKIEENKLNLSDVNVSGEVASLNNKVKEDIYKGYMNVGKDTEYKTQLDLLLSYSDVASKIKIENIVDNTDSDNLVSYYNKTTINKQQALNLLGESGVIKIYNKENMNTPIKQINLAEQTEENYYTVEYGKNVSEITIETSKPVAEGKLEILNEKTLKVVDASKPVEATKLNTNAKLTILDNQENKQIDINKTGTVEFKDPKTEIEIQLDENSISNQVENTLTVTTVLKTVKPSQKLFSNLENSKIQIELPKEITSAEIQEDVQILYAENELTIKSADIKTNEEGNKILEIELEGNQTDYTKIANIGGPSIIVTLKVQAEKFMADKNVEIKATFINDANIEAEAKNNLEITAKKGLVTKNIIKVGENKVENINEEELTITELSTGAVDLGTKIINNYNEEIKSLEITGNVATSLSGSIVTNIENAQISYSEGSNKWATDVQDYSKIKAFKIEANNILKGQEIDIDYSSNLESVMDGNVISSIKLDYQTGEQSLSKNIKFKLNNNSYPNRRGAPALQTQTNYGAQISIKPLTTTDVLHEEQIVTYKITVKNTGDTAINNAKLVYTRPEGTVLVENISYNYQKDNSDIWYTDNTHTTNITVDENSTNKTWTEINLNPEETIEKLVTVKINQGTEGIVNTIDLKNENDEPIAAQIVTDSVEVKPAELSLTVTNREVEKEIALEGEIITYIVEATNLTDNTLENVKIEVKIPDNMQVMDKSYNNIGWAYDQNEKIAYFTISKIEPHSTYHLSLDSQVGKLEEDNIQISTNVIAITNVNTQNETRYESNLNTTDTKKVNMNITMSTNKQSQIKENEDVTYTVEVTNTDDIPANIYIKSTIANEIKLKNANVYVGNNKIDEDGRENFTSNTFGFDKTIEKGQTLKIVIEGKAKELPNYKQEESITSYAQIYLNNQEIKKSIDIKQTIKKEAVDPGQGTNPPTPGTEDQYYSISGLAWLDKNKNGIRDNQEEILKDIKVVLLDEQGNIAKDKDGNNLQTQTTMLGTYKFDNLNNGSYMVAFIYDNSKYSLTKYQAQNAALDSNSDAINKTIKLDNTEQIIAVTDILVLKDNNIQNIDIGLVLNEKFDLSLNKHIDKVVITNEEGTTTYTFDADVSLAKVEIPAKYIDSSNVLVEYSIEVTNKGELEGYVEDLVDYIPKDLSFSSELNPTWYQDQNGNLHNNSLEKTLVKPGEKAIVKLILMKTNNGAGIITNKAEIASSSNLQNINDKKLEDNTGKAELIVSIKTGSASMYIGIVLGSLALLGTGVYLINKKILKGGI